MSFFFRVIPKGFSSLFPTATPHAAPQLTSQQTPSVNIRNSIFSNTSPNHQVKRQEFSRSIFPNQNDEGTAMHKTKKIGTCLLIGTLLTTSFGLSANETTRTTSSKALRPIVSSRVQGTEWVRKCVEQYPEILWLADDNVRKTEEGQATLKAPYSEQLFGKKFVEFDRTIMTLHCLQLVLDGSEKAYQEFTAAQPNDAKLLRTSFEKLHLQGIELVKSKYNGMSELEITQAMEAALVLGDIGKSEKARDIFKPYGAKAPDHDDFHGEVMEILEHHPKLCPTFDRLTPAAKKLLGQTANLAHYGHVTHIEGGPGMFSKLKQSGLPAASSVALAFDLFVHTCDVAGALGHVNNQSSLVYAESSHQAMQAVAKACAVLTDSQKTEMDAYNTYLRFRADCLGLNAEDRTDRALTRMGAMLRLFTPEDGLILKQSVLKLNPEQQAKIIEQLDTEMGQDFARTPTYMPAVLVNLSNNPQLGSSREERLSQAVVLGLPFLSRVLEKHKQTIAENKANPNIPLNFNKAAGVAKVSPDMLLKDFYIDSEGNVCFTNS